MSEQTPQQDNQEIDLGAIFGQIRTAFLSLIKGFFNFIAFLKRNAIILIGLFIAGVVIGFLLDNYKKKYVTETIVTTNQISPDYLYSKIDFLQSKVFSSDSVFFNKIGVKDYKSIENIEIEPIIDIYSFINSNTAIANNAQNTQNFEMIKLLSESSDLDKVLKDELTSKNYPFQTIKIISGKKINPTQTKAIFDYLNSDEYYKNLLKISLENIKQETINNEITVKQLDTLIMNMSANIKNQKTATIQIGGEKSQVADLISQKRDLLQTNLNNKLRLITQAYIVKDLSTVSNKTYTKGVNNKLKLIFPVLFLAIFFVYHYFKQLKKKHSIL